MYPSGLHDAGRVHWTTTPTYDTSGYIGPRPLQYHRVHGTTPAYGLTGYIGPCPYIVLLDHDHLITRYIGPHPLMV